MVKRVVVVIALLVAMSVLAMGEVKAYSPYDLNNDGVVDVRDIEIVAKHFGSWEGHPRWNPQVDFDKDGFITIIDVYIVAVHFGEDCPPDPMPSLRATAGKF